MPLFIRITSARLRWKGGKIGSVKEVINKETLSSLYHVDFEIMEIDGKPLSIYY